MDETAELIPTRRSLLIAQVKKEVDPKMYQVFDLYVFKEWSVARIVRALQVTPANVYLAKHRITTSSKPSQLR